MKYFVTFSLGDLNPQMFPGKLYLIEDWHPSVECIQSEDGFIVPEMFIDDGYVVQHAILC